MGGLAPVCGGRFADFGRVFRKWKICFIATAHYRNGILLAPLTAKILAEKIVENKDSDYLKVFSPEQICAERFAKFEYFGLIF